MRNLRTKRVLIPTAVLAVLAVGGGVFWASASADDLAGSERDRVSAAAVDAVGGGEVVTAESVDDQDDRARGEAYEVEVRQSDGTEVDVTLDRDLQVLERDGAADADDRVLSATERRSAERAALAAVGSGRVTDVDASDDRGTAYDVEVTTADGREWDVDLDSSFGVLGKVADR